MSEFLPIAAGRTGELSEKGWTGTIAWEVTYDEPKISWVEVVTDFCTSNSCQVGGVETTTQSIVKKVSADCGDDGCTWTVQVQVEPGEGSQQQGTNPLTEPAKVSGSFSKQTIALDYDYKGKPVINSAGQPFSNALEIDDSRPIVSVTKNVSSIPISLYLYKDAINATPFLGASQYTVKVQGSDWDGPNYFTYNQTQVEYWTVKVSFEFNPNGWKRYVLDQGMSEIKSGKLAPILLNGQPVSEPVMLNGRGQQAQPGAQPYYHTFQVYPELPFSFFNQLLGV